ncbi:hypothetical protein DSCO28_72950 (plasmid) [Desulfosarcina ovata subsp. sediminis]|uniref:Uncharacterized protein n=1 Tax=Desulfosarcina ovata subsp. sediminis TaxID=885957 RepID=A0A5K8A2G0_9BACT|nr:hypothetical protein DSCO28_72950 [Desulfosarcina ovata subsp. sediminis]
MRKFTNDDRINKIRRILHVKTDAELSGKLNTNQPQISRWRRVGFARSTEALIDYLIGLIADLKSENRKLRKKLRSIDSLR